ncbi:meiosis regulator and mRNA stability factor 1-like [Amphibalanus amphitrite]|uniref:meiosis regulator and mRNA stability factor 1-like n=1 Tax=Amphibalanus amphitrite TaxID=1232801 RepID=UPI001C923F59|nr:meiosis regulator and mRNA stability factor 1-like [Amphibalanus amphitrite]
MNRSAGDMTSNWSDPSVLDGSAAALRQLLTPAQVTSGAGPGAAEPLPSTAWVEAWLSGCVPGRDGAETASTRVESTPAADGADADEVRSTKSDSVCYQLQPIGVFWDIENCQVPRRCSAGDFVSLIRDHFYANCWEAEFMCACDVSKVFPATLQQLNDAQVSVMHVPATSKNAADEKVKQSLRRFSDQYPAPATVLLITGDMNFAPDLNFLKHRKKHRVILIHNRQARPALLNCADERHLFDDLLAQLPDSRPQQVQEARSADRLCCHLRLTGLSPNGRKSKVVNEIQKLVYNCGGRVERVNLPAGEAIVVFPSPSNAARAKHRLHHVVICGSQTYVTFYYKSSGRSSRQGLRSDIDSGMGQDSLPPAQEAPLQPPPALWPPEPRTRSSSVSTQTSPEPAVERPGSSRADSAASVATQTSPDGQLTASSLGSSPSTDASPRNPDRTPAPRRGDLYDQRFQSRPPVGAGDTPYGSPRVGRMDVPPPPPARPLGASPVGGGGGGRARSGSPAVGGSSGGLDGPVELTVTNLDSSRHPRDMEKLLLELASRHTKVESLSVYCQSDGSMVASVVVPTQFDSQALIAEMHRAVIGNKRIMLSYARVDKPERPYKIRAQVIRLLNDVPSGQLPLVKFMELYEQRFHSTVSIADLFRMRETITVVDSSSGRVIQLNPALKTQDLGVSGRPAAGSACLRHPPQRGATVGWAERDDPSVLPNSEIQLEELEPIIYRLLNSHDGVLFLSSLLDCYSAEFHDPGLSRLRLEPNAVCLEHLLTWLPEVRVVTRSQDKAVVWARDAPEEEPAPVNPALQQKVVMFSREVVDLLRAAPRARMPFNRFIPAYHHHFGRQCRVSDYGFTRLADLFDALPHIVQVLGCGHRRVITLTPRAQQRRFASDLLRVLKAQHSKQLSVAALPEAFGQVLGREFAVWDYGATRLHTLLRTVNGESVVVYKHEGELKVAIPRREQTPEEMQKTKHFATEVKELLRHVPFCQMQFNKFIPAYHHHFGRQCRVSDYGFGKLAELFEAVPETVQVSSDEDGEKLIQLTRPALLSVLSDQLVAVLQTAASESVGLDELCQLFLREFGYRLSPAMYGAANIRELLSQLRAVVRVTGPADSLRVLLVNRQHLKQTALNVRLLLMDQPQGCMPLDRLLEQYACRYQQPLSLDTLTAELQHVLKVEGSPPSARHVRLLPLQLLARDVVRLLRRHGGRLQLAGFHAAFLAEFGVAARPAQFGYHSTPALLEALDDTVTLRGRGAQRSIHLLREFTTGCDSNGGSGDGRPQAAGGAPEPQPSARGPPPPPVPVPGPHGDSVDCARRPPSPGMQETGCMYLASPPAPSELPRPQFSWLPPPPPTPPAAPQPGPPPAPAPDSVPPLPAAKPTPPPLGAHPTPPERRSSRGRSRIAAQFPPSPSSAAISTTASTAQSSTATTTTTTAAAAVTAAKTK